MSKPLILKVSCAIYRTVLAAACLVSSYQAEGVVVSIFDMRISASQN